MNLTAKLIWTEKITKLNSLPAILESSFYKQSNGSFFYNKLYLQNKTMCVYALIRDLDGWGQHWHPTPFDCCCCCFVFVFAIYKRPPELPPNSRVHFVSFVLLLLFVCYTCWMVNYWYTFYLRCCCCWWCC